MDMIEDSRYMGSQLSHVSKLSEALNQQRLEQSELCDVTITVNGKEMKAHWCVLVTCPFFESMFSSGLAEKTSGKVKISIGKSYIFEKILEYIYKGNLEITVDLAGEFLEFAEYLQMSSLRTLCENSLDCTPLNPKNCVKMCIIASMYELKVHDKAVKYLRGHLREVMKLDEMLQLCADSVLSILKDETLCYITQEEFLDFIKRWIRCNSAERKCYGHDLLKSVDFGKVSSSSLEGIRNDSVLADAFKSLAITINSELEKRAQRCCPPTKIDNSKKDVILMGTSRYEYGTKMSRILALVVDEDKWTEICSLPTCNPIFHPVIGFDGQNKIYVLNTEKFRKPFVHVRLYDFSIETKVWRSRKVSLPVDHLNQLSYEVDLLICQERVFLLLNRFKRMKSNASNAIPKPTIQLLEVKADGRTDQYYIMDSPGILKIKTFVVDKCHIGIFSNESVGTITKPGKCRVIFYNIEDKKIITPSKGNSFPSKVEHSLVFASDGIFRHIDLMLGVGRTYNLSTKCWEQMPSICSIPYESRFSAKFVFCDNQLYFIGGKCKRTMQKYDYEKKKRVCLNDLPYTMIDSAMCTARLPVEMISCHLQCPHCYYNPKLDFDHTEPEQENDEDIWSDGYSYRYRFWYPW